MKCANCGYESEQDFSFCPGCGAETQQNNPAAEKILSALKDSLFLVLCILMSASCILTISADGLPLIDILITVFMWLAYAQSRKDIADAKHLRSVSGAVFAHYVIVYVVAGLCLLVGVIFALVFGSLANDPSFMDTLLSGFITSAEDYAMFAQLFASLSGGVVMTVFAFVCVLLVVFNIFSLRYIHGFAQSVYQSVESGNLVLKYKNATRNWLFVLGVINGLSSLTSFGEGLYTAGLASVVSCAIMIIAGVMINKHFSNEE